MFDSFYDETGREWQTKAFDCNLDVWQVGDRFETEGPQTFQVEVLGSDRSAGRREDFRDSFATIRAGRVESVDVPRDETLLLFNYSSGFVLPEDDA
jgi:hypothetical protein